MPDRWRLWSLWKEHGFEELVQQSRRAPWVRDSSPASSIQRRRFRSRSPKLALPGFYPKEEQVPRTSASAAPGPPASSSSACSAKPGAILRPVSTFASRPPAHPASSVSNIPWPCQMCRKVPWRCRCRPRAEETDEELSKLPRVMRVSGRGLSKIKWKPTGMRTATAHLCRTRSQRFGCAPIVGT